MLSYILLSALLIVATNALGLDMFRMQRCSSFDCTEDGCTNERLACDKPPACNSVGLIQTTFLCESCRLRCCEMEQVLNARSFGVNFDARITTTDTSKACRLLRDEGSVIDAFRFGSSLSTTCGSFQIVIDIASMSGVPGWSVCFVRFGVVKITAAVITVPGNPSTNANISTKGFVSQIINQTGNLLTINFKGSNDPKIVCTYEVKNIEVVACPLPPVITTPVPTTIATTQPPTSQPPITIPPVRFCSITKTPFVNFLDNIGRVCNPTQGEIFKTTCSGSCPTSSIGQVSFNDRLCVQPSTNSTLDVCQCCKGTGQWVYYNTICAIPGGFPVSSTVAVFQLSTCDCV